LEEREYDRVIEELNTIKVHYTYARK
jgi:hypothetical protein